MFLIAGLGLTLFIRLQNLPRPRISVHDLRIILVLTASAEISAPILLYIGLGLTTASHASLIGVSEIVFTVMFASLLFGELISLRKGICIGMVATGVAAVTLGNGIHYLNLGDLLILGAAACYALDNSYTVRLSNNISSERLMQIKFLLGGLVMGCLAGIGGAFSLAELSSNLPFIIYMALLPFAASCVLGTRAVRSIGASATIVIVSINIPLGILLAVVLLHETINIPLIIGASASVGLGVYYFGKCR